MTGAIRIGTRASKLALWQSEWVAGQLRSRGLQVEIVRLTTQGDVKQGPLAAIGGQGLFTKEIQRALLDGSVDLAVHSLKDLPTDPVEGLSVAAVPPRESAHDALISRSGEDLSQLPEGAKLGTGSLRRRSQLRHARADLAVADIRGNLDTRLKKLEEGQYDAIVLAEAGLRRLGWQDRITQVLPFEVMLPAVGQGALGLETREDDEPTRQAAALLNDDASHAAVIAERALLRALRAGCLAPVGAAGIITDDQLELTAVVLSEDGRDRIIDRQAATVDQAAKLGEAVAARLIEQGAAELIASARG